MKKVKLYRVKIEVEAIVLAADSADAAELAKRNFKEISAEGGKVITADKYIKGDPLPEGWDLDNYPFSAGNTCEDSIACIIRAQRPSRSVAK